VMPRHHRCPVGPPNPLRNVWHHPYVPLFGGSDANTEETMQSPLPPLFRTAANHGSKISQLLSVSRTLALWPAMVK
jgi:hypothetical protein